MGDVGVVEDMALDGLRVLDFCRLGFGSQATLILGCLGADVIRVESTTRPDPIRVMPPFIPEAGEQGEGFGGATLANANKVQSLDRGGIFYKYNTGGKRSIAVDARHPDGLSVLERLVAVSDVVTESFAAGTLARWGLGYERLRELRPDVIYVSMCGYGHTGPDSSFVTMGPTAQALTGLTHMVGLPGREPAGWSFSYLDHVGGYLGAVAVLSALAHRRATGEGQHVDVSQLEPATALAGALLLDRTVNGRSARRGDFPPGNRRGGAPQGAYRAADDPDGAGDKWVVISCRDEVEWRAFVAAIGAPPWTADPRFATLEGRRANADVLDDLVTSWTSGHDRYETMHLLQAAKVPCGAVQDAADRLERDPQLAARHHFVPLGNAEVGELPLEGVPFDLSATPPHAGGRLRRGPPCIDQDGDEVLRDVLGLDDAEIARLRDAGSTPVTDSGALSGTRVVELVDEPVEYCGRLLAGLGADVIKVEPPAGGRSRLEGPWVDGREGDPDASLASWHFDLGKRSVVIDPDAPDGGETIRRLCSRADVVVHTLGPAAAARRGLDHASLAADAPALISCAITPFGLTGPWSDYIADDLVLMALGGSMAACGYGTADPPLACWGDQAWLTAATYGAIAVLAALDHRDRTGTGQLIDVSAHQSSASMTEWHVMTYLCSGAPMARFRHPTVTARDGKQVAALVPDFLGPHVFEHFRTMLEADGVAGPLSDPVFEDPRHRARNYGELMAATARLAERHDGEELFRLGQQAGLPWGVIRSPDEALDDRHLQARGHWVEIDGVTHAGAPFVAGASPFRFGRPPPRLGQHTDEILAELGVAPGVES